MKKFICLFPTGEDIVLVKDVGMIPYYMAKDGYYDAYISFYKAKEELSYLESDLKGLKYVRMKNFFNNELFSIFFFLVKNLFRYDVVMLFHPTPYKMLMANLFKVLSFNKIKFYFKVDADHRIVEQNLYKQTWNSKIKLLLSKRIALFSAESREVCHYLNEQSYYHNVKYIPNGCVISDNLADSIKKEKIFLTVGRLGTYQKDTETLMEAFSLSCQYTDWRLVLVGAREEAFDQYLKTYFQKHPWASERVDILGPIYDREKLTDIYKRSAVFVLSSRYESFGLVLLEAMAQGCYILSTNLSPSKDILSDNKLGMMYPVEGRESLAELMQKVMTNQNILPEPQYVHDYVMKNYSWHIVVDKIVSYLNNTTISN